MDGRQNGHGHGAAVAAISTVEFVEDEPGYFVEAVDESDAEDDDADVLVHLDDLEQEPEPEPLLEDMLQQQSLAMVFGPPGVGKSFWAFDAAARVAYQGHNVIYVAAENYGGYKRRSRAWKDYYQCDPANMYVWKRKINLLEPEGRLGWTRFVRRVQHFNPALIVIDTLQQCMVGAGDSTQEYSTALAALDDIRTMNKVCTVLIVHHTTKGGEWERGPLLRATVDTSIRLEDDLGLVKVICDKQRNSEEFPTYTMQLVKWMDSLVADRASSYEYDTSGPLTRKEFDVLRTLDLTAFRGFGASALDVSEVSGASKQHTWRVLSKLTDRGYVDKPESRKNAYWHITDAGTDFLRTNYKADANPQPAPTLVLPETRHIELPRDRPSSLARFKRS